MPALEMAQETGKLVAWRKKEGERVAKGDILLEIETDKAVMEIESPGDGILAGVKAQEGAVVPVGQTIAWLVAPGETPPKESAPSSSGRKTTIEPARLAVVADAPAKSAGGSARISPKARRLAQEKGVDLARLTGSGPDGEILAEDVLAAASAPPATSNVGALGPIGRLMAERTTQSWTSVPHFFVTRDVNATGLVEAREKLGSAIEQKTKIKLTHTDLIVAVVARALLKHPRVNGSWAGNGIRLNPDVNVAIAMAVDDGVVAAVISNTAKIGLDEIAVQRKELTERARAGKLRPADITGGTFTVSNLGMYQVDAFSAIITPPQAAILAVGRIGDRVVSIDGKPAVRPMFTMTVSSDHRVVDGARAALFLNDLVEAMHEPEKWLR
jgi:pyruvate dehydrogenase E2 component (dihydrolipoamide acetyltransferase)